jgi:predicted MPP superfamily phosphohydrolase
MRTTYYDLKPRKEMGNIKIALFSDLHFSGRGYNKQIFKNIIKNLNRNKPNYICIPGDTFDNYEFIKRNPDDFDLLNFFFKIAKIAPVLISLGNHDVMESTENKKVYAFPLDLTRRLSKVENIHILDNNSITLDGICFYGLSLPFPIYFKKPDIQYQKFSEYLNNNPINFPKDTYNVLLSHSPVIFQNEKIFEQLPNIDLILSGHMHNGGIPIIVDKFYHGHGGIIAPNKGLFPKYSRGYLKLNQGKTDLIISKGIVTISRMAPFIFKGLRPFYPKNIEYITFRGNDEKEK